MRPTKPHLRRAAAALAIVAVAAGAAAVRPAHAPRAEFEVDEGIAFHWLSARYAVSGAAGHELRAQMDALGPEHPQTRVRRDALTWAQSFGWRARWVNGSRPCAPTRVDVSVHSTTTLPYWDFGAFPVTDSTLIARWNAYLLALDRHEDEHRALIKESAHAFRQTALRQRAPDCSALAQRIAFVRDSLERHYGWVHQSLDARTRYGALQGARWVR